MSNDTLHSTREMLRSGEVSLQGRLTPADRETLLRVDEEVRKVVGEIDRLFQAISDTNEGNDFANLFAAIYGKMAKAYLRSKKSADQPEITAGELGAFWREVQDIIVLFNEKGVRVDALLLEKVMTYGGLSYWQEFFEKEFAGFADTPGIVRRAAEHYSKDPRAFLRQVEANVAEILGEKEFAGFTDTPGIVRHAAVGHKDPRVFLRQVEANVAEILGEKEFAGFTDTPGIVRRAAVHYPKDPRAFLRQNRFSSF